MTDRPRPTRRATSRWLLAGALLLALVALGVLLNLRLLDPEAEPVGSLSPIVEGRAEPSATTPVPPARRPRTDRPAARRPAPAATPRPTVPSGGGAARVEVEDGDDSSGRGRGRGRSDGDSGGSGSDGSGGDDD